MRKFMALAVLAAGLAAWPSWAQDAAASRPPVEISAFGVKAGDGQDATPAVRAALEHCRTAKIQTLAFGPGRYDFWPDRAVEQYGFVSNNDEGLKRIVFLLAGMENFEVDGRGATFVFHGFTTPVVVDHSRNITLKGFSIDFARTFHSEGIILAAGENSLDLEFSEAFPCEVRNGILVFTDGRKSQEPQTTVKGTELTFPYGSLLEFDTKKRETAYQAHDYWVKGGVTAQALGPRRVRITVPKLTGTPGNTLVFGAANRDCPGIVIADSAGVTLSQVNLYHCGGMGVIAQRSRDLMLDRAQVTTAPGSGRIVSITADATHFVNCSGKITLSHCLFENQKDDATNIHGIYARIARKLAPEVIEVQLIHPQQYGFDFIVPGGKLELVHGRSLVTYGEAVVKSVERVNKEFTRVTLAERLPDECIIGDVVAGNDGYPETWIHDCVIRCNRARGILLGSRARMVIEDNVFHTPGAAILLEGDGRFWYEQAGVRDLVIRKNLFDNCNFGVWGKATIEVGAGIEKDCRATSRYNRNILIEDNRFRTFGSGPLVQMYSVDGLTIRNNRLEKTEAYPSRPGNAQPFDIVDSDNVKTEPLKMVEKP